MDHFEVPSDVHHGEANLMAFDSSPYEVQRWRRYRFMYAEREKLRVQGIQGHRLFLVVDESLMLFLASRQGRRLSALFRCTFAVQCRPSLRHDIGPRSARVVLRPRA